MKKRYDASYILWIIKTMKREHAQYVLKYLLDRLGTNMKCWKCDCETDNVHSDKYGICFHCGAVKSESLVIFEQDEVKLRRLMSIEPEHIHLIFGKACSCESEPDDVYCHLDDLVKLLNIPVCPSCKTVYFLVSCVAEIGD